MYLYFEHLYFFVKQDLAFQGYTSPGALGFYDFSIFSTFTFAYFYLFIYFSGFGVH